MTEQEQMQNNTTETRDDAGISTADLAYGRDTSPSQDSENTQVEQVPTQRAGSASDRAAAETTPLFDQSVSEEFRGQWMEIQGAFVDDPRSAVERADALVAETMKRLAEVFAEERQELEGQWSQGNDVDTEALRVALRRYRSFFDRLLSV